MGLFDSLADLINKFIPSRKGSMVDTLNDLTFKYSQALKEGRDMDAAALRVQLNDLRKKIGFTDGDI